jgi:hypothetical protein
MPGHVCGAESAAKQLLQLEVGLVEIGDRLGKGVGWLALEMIEAFRGKRTGNPEQQQ